MFNNISAALNESTVDYPITDSRLPFSDYIAQTRNMIEERRFDIPNVESSLYDTIVHANCPYELAPMNPMLSGDRLKYGALLIHGLLDSPFSLKDIGVQLQQNGILNRSILLPGHGTVPSDLLQVSYHDWIQAVRYGVDTLRKEVDEIFLIGYSTGAALSVYQALHDTHIKGIVLLSPAIRIKTPVDIMVGWNYFLKLLCRKNTKWVYHQKEIDYAKYKSIAFNPVSQVSLLTDVIREVSHTTLNIPMLMVVSREDETISSHKAIDFFSRFHHENSQLLLYSSFDHEYPDHRILTRQSYYKDLHIKHLSHISIPFSPNNTHYGQEGDYIYASHIKNNRSVYGAFNPIEQKIYHSLYHLGLLRKARNELTYNPDFDFMSDKIVKFILGNT